VNLSDGLVESIFAGLSNIYVDWSCNAEGNPLAEQVSFVRMICATLLARVKSFHIGKEQSYVISKQANEI
jgi:hypothetical protein